MPRKASPVAERPSIFRRTDDGVPEMSEHLDRQTSSRLRPKRTKRTFYLPDDVILSLGEIQLARHRQSGSKPELSEIVEEAIRNLVQQQQNA